MFESVATLIRQGEPTFDKYGNEQRAEIEREVFVKTRGVYQSEFYNAAQLGLKPSITFELTNKVDYNGEKVLFFQGRKYSVIRADWNADRDKISLICEERVENE